MEKVIIREELDKWLNGLIQSGGLIAPVREDEDLVLFEPVRDLDEIVWDYLNTTRALKDFFFLQNEELFRFEGGPQDVRLEERPLSEEKMVIFGVRPCDARGLFVLDKLFSQDSGDELYLARRESSVVVGVACDNPDWACFCTSMGGSPYSMEGLDILLVDLGNGRFRARIITDKGGELFASVSAQPYEEYPQRRERQQEEAEGKIVKKVAPDRDLEAVFDDPYWERISRTCLSCGVCTFLCPTCHCFDLADEGDRRFRLWDACAFPNFTIQASGENPRLTKAERYRQRVLHKFHYFKKNFGVNLCVGCGRCIRFCPVRIDIADVVNNAPGK